DHVQRNKNSQADTNQTEKPSEEKPQTEKPEEETPREEKPQSEKPESPKPTEEPEEESPEESEEPQVETEKVEEKLREAEDLLGKIQDPIIKSNAKETLTGLKNNLLFGTQDNNTIMAEAEKLLALLKENK
ncbi:TPA: histidine motif-containing protein, partial [Streptococcus pneumoniae]|nr:histidine motif-containing protein [Streptococcus pneumoniae]HEU8441483.1 histidine motif-containing protein [Streptococcus pneumoniae]